MLNIRSIAVRAWFKNQLGPQLIVGVLFLVGGGGALSIWGAVQDWDAPVKALFALGTVTLLLIFWNQWTTVWTRLFGEWGFFRKQKDVVRKWLDEFGHSVTTLPDSEALEFNFITEVSSRQIQVLKRKDDQLIRAGVGIKFAPEDANQITRETVEEWQIKMAEVGIIYSMTYPLTLITLEVRAPFHYGFDKNNLLDLLQKMTEGFVIFSLLLKRVLPHVDVGEPEKPETGAEATG